MYQRGGRNKSSSRRIQMMKKTCITMLFVIFPVLLLSLASCTNPILKWIETPPDDLKVITNFSLGVERENVKIGDFPDGTGRFPILVILPAGQAMDNLIPSIDFIGMSLDPPSGVPRNFNFSQLYRVTAHDNTFRDYPVTVITDDGSSREITGFVFEELEARGLKIEPLISGVPRPDGSLDILVVVPPDTNLVSLSPRITHTGVSISGDGFPVLGVPTTTTVTTLTVPAPQNFSSPKTDPRTYTVRAENGSTNKYIVTVVPGFTGNPGATTETGDKEITGFYFTSPLAVGEIDQDKNHITVTVPPGTNLGALIPMVYYRGKSLSPVSGALNDFTTPRRYTVTAGDNSVRNYDVQVVAKPSSTKEIVGLSFGGVTVAKTVIGSVPGPDGKFPIDVVVKGRPNLAGLSPVINHTGKSINPASGSVQNFSSPVTYRVSAEDGSTKDYAVTVYFGDSGKIITGFSFDSAPGGPIVGQIYQAAHTIEVVVPSGDPWNSINTQIPTITYFGASIAYSGPSVKTSPVTVNPFQDTPHNFSTATHDNPITYTVTGTDGSTQDYAVIVTRADENLHVNVNFVAISDATGLLSYKFNKDSGLVTVTIDTATAGVLGFLPPYKWYLDAKECPAVNTEATLVIQTKDLDPGHQYEVVVVLNKGGLYYTSRLYFVITK
jgi:hypothetical protein